MSQEFFPLQSKFEENEIRRKGALKIYICTRTHTCVCVSTFVI